MCNETNHQDKKLFEKLAQEIRMAERAVESSEQMLKLNKQHLKELKLQLRPEAEADPSEWRVPKCRACKERIEFDHKLVMVHIDSSDEFTTSTGKQAFHEQCSDFARLPHYNSRKDHGYKLESVSCKNCTRQIWQYRYGKPAKFCGHGCKSSFDRRTHKLRKELKQLGSVKERQA